MTTTDPNQVIASRKENYSAAAALRFPSDIGAQAMVMNFTEFKFNPGGESFNIAGVNGGSIVLPIPINLNDETSLNVNSAELGIPGAALYDILSAVGDGGAAGFGSMIYDKAKSLVVGRGYDGHPGNGQSQDAIDMAASLKLYSKLVGRAIVDAVPGGGTAVDMASRSTINPFMTVDFNGVMLKQHTFTWTLSPRNEAESEAIRLIIRKLKIHSLPAYSDQADVLGGTSEVLKNALLTYPDLVKINFVGIDEDHYYKFKPAMIKNIVATYNNGDKLHVLEGGKPATVQLNITVLESAIHTKADYTSTT